MENINQLKLMIIIVKAGYADQVMHVAREAGAGGATIINVRGEGSAPQSFMGITMDSEKEMIFSLADGETAVKAMSAIEEKAGLQSAAHGICFVMPVEKVIGVSSLLGK